MTKIRKQSVKVATFTKIEFAISLAKIWQKEFRILPFNTLFSIAMKMDDEEFLRYCRLYDILGKHISHTVREKIDELVKEESDNDI